MMKLVALDFETHYAPEYTLKKLTTEAYINDPRFEIIGAGLAVSETESAWISYDNPYDYRKRLLFLNDCAIVCHNAPFDAAILSWRLGIQPKLIIDTLSMSRGWFGNTVRNDLGAVAERLGLPPKGHEVEDFKGYHLRDFAPAELKAYAEYCKNDARLTLAIFKRLMAAGFPAEELRKIDVVIRAFTEPSLQLDPEKLQEELKQERNRKQELLNRVALAGGAAEFLRSKDKFAQLLRDLGVEPPKKLSAKKSAKAGHDVYDYAFAKGDADFKALLDHEDEMVVAAVEARMGHTSTQKETRAQRFLDMRQRTRGWLPVPLLYGRAHTLRLAGGDKVNLQNLPRTDKKDKTKGLLRQAIMAPPESEIVVGDLAQIEARILAGLAGQDDLIEAFADKRDVYSEQASVIYSRHVDRKKNPDDFLAGFVGKCVVLGCGYQLGHMKFGAMIYVGMLGGPGVTFDLAFAEQLDVDISDYYRWVESKPDLANKAEALRPMAMEWGQWLTHLACANRIIRKFRDGKRRIVELWDTGKRAIEAMYAGSELQFGGRGNDVLRTDKDGDTGIIWSPNGMRLLYPGLEFDGKDYSCLRYKEGRVKRVKLYGGLVVENCTQHLAGVKIGQVMVDMRDEGYRVALQVHDEIAAVVPRERAKEAESFMLERMRVSPRWMPYLPLEAEVGIARRYGDAK